MYVIVGESASGKTTLVKNLIKNNPEFSKVVTCTTRPKRDHETDGIDYLFMTEKAFRILAERDTFAEFSVYRGWYYGVEKSMCGKDNSVAILTPAGLRALKADGYDITSIYLSVDRKSRLIRQILRGDDIDEAYRRNLSDCGQFDGIEREVDYVIDNYEFHMNEKETLQCLLRIIETVSESGGE